MTATTCQSSYPLNSENASPFGTCTVYLSCAEMALPPKTASTTAMITVSQDGILVMAIPPCDLQVKFSVVRSNDAGSPPATYNFLSKFCSHTNRHTSSVLLER